MRLFLAFGIACVLTLGVPAAAAVEAFPGYIDSGFWQFIHIVHANVGACAGSADHVEVPLAGFACVTYDPGYVDHLDSYFHLP